MEKTGSGNQPKDVWASGEAYEAYVGRWSRIVAHKFFAWLAAPPGGLWLDVGCGTGVLTQTLLEVAAPQVVKGIDASEGFLTFVSKTITDKRATFQLGDARALPVETAAFDAVVSGFMLNFVPQPDQVVAEMARAAKSGGLVAAYVWDYAAADLDQGRRFSLCNPGPLADLFRDAGLTGIEVRPIDIWMVFKDFDDYWLPFLGGQGSAPSYLASLSGGDRSALRERIRAALPFALDGSIPLLGRAWAVRGVR